MGLATTTLSSSSTVLSQRKWHPVRHEADISHVFFIQTVGTVRSLNAETCVLTDV